MIFISAGHHPERKGARFKNYCEHDEAKIWVSELIGLLGDRAKVVPTGLLKQKVEFINRNKAELAIEVHFNSYKKWDDRNKDGIVDEDELIAQGKGCETLYFPGSKLGKILADEVNAAMAQIFFPDRGVKEGWFRMKKDTVADYFLAKTNCPAIIIEPEFIHRIDIIQKNRTAACAGIASTLLDFMEHKL